MKQFKKLINVLLISSIKI